ncbi:MAG: FHIPEP family type III secretion protein [Deltaproteobacteria bacterium]|nr:FHIPEP family type III secretion protein [Deltaproteobacteria bacterium]
MRQSIIPLFVIGIIASLLVPLPPQMMDFLLAGNLLLALVLLTNTLYIVDPLRLSALPTILLLATLFRLALNISTTRLILSQGDAGRVVEAFGAVVIQGNLVVGIVVFSIITLVQFIVIAKGSERVAEVSARFTLDALPGKQMSIDADMRSGLIDMETARKKRKELQVESRFYGALDGAMKFIKGDAIAGIAIVLINFVGGLLIGMLQNDLGAAQALSKYGILTVGDGLLSQIPALMNSLAAGMVVTRVVASEGTPVASEILTQISQIRVVGAMVGGIALVLTAAPGMPSWPFFLLGSSLLAYSAWPKTVGSEDRSASVSAAHFQPQLPPLISIELTKPAALLLHKAAGLLEKVDNWRQRAYEKYGLILLRPDLVKSAGGPALRICTRGMPVVQREIDLEWLRSGDVDEAEELLNIIIEELDQLLDGRAGELVDDILTRRLLDFFERGAPELVSSIIPNALSVTQLTSIFRRLLDEDISLRHLDIILQAVAENSARASDDKVLLQEVRIALKRVIAANIMAKYGESTAFTLDVMLDIEICDNLAQGLPPNQECLASILSALSGAGKAPKILIASKYSRAALRECLVQRRFNVPVLAHEEIADELRFTSIETVRKGALQMQVERAEALAA